MTLSSLLLQHCYSQYFNSSVNNYYTQQMHILCCSISHLSSLTSQWSHTECSSV